MVLSGRGILSVLISLIMFFGVFCCSQTEAGKPKNRKQDKNEEQDIDLQTLVNQVKEKRPEAQVTASRLGLKGTAVLIPLTEDPDPEVRNMALICLGITGGGEVSKVALKKLKDEDDQVVAQALQVLYKHPPVGMEKELVDAYKTAEESVREDLPLIAGRLAPHVDPSPWREFWQQEKKGEIKKSLLLALSRMGDEQARREFVKQLLSSQGAETLKWIDHCRYMEHPWIVPHLLPLFNRQEVVVYLTPDLKNKRPMRLVDFVIPVVVELTGAKVSFPVKRTDPFTPEEIEQVRRIAIQSGKK